MRKLRNVLHRTAQDPVQTSRVAYGIVEDALLVAMKDVAVELGVPAEPPDPEALAKAVEFVITEVLPY